VATKAKDDKFLKQARDRWKLADTATQKQRKRELEDLRFYAGDQWDEDLLRARAGQSIGSGSGQQTVPARPSLTINKTREPVRQVLNQERQSDLGITLVPADDFGEVTGPIDHSEIELREGLVRRIQRDSESRDARTWAFARAAIAGTGYWLVMTRYVPGKTQDQEVYVERIYNQNSVLLDPSHEQPDGSDAEWGFWGTDMLQSAFKAQYPDSDIADIDNDDEWRTLGDEAPGWFEGEGDKRSVRVMNYVYTERKPKEVYHLTNGGAAYDDELMDVGVDEKGFKIRALKTDPSATVQLDDKGKELCHTEVSKQIKWAKITGCETLEKTDWAGHYQPIIKTVGEELQPYDGERRIEGIVRPMRDPCKGNNYIISKFVEQVGLTPIPPWMMAGGQDEGYQDEYNASTTRAIAVLHYNQKDENGQLVPSPPQRTNVSTDVSALAQGVAIFGQAIQSTSVMPETALGHTDPTVKSAKLARALIEQGSQGTSNFLDNLVRSLRHEARVQNDLLYPIYNRPGRLARMMNGQGEMSAVLIGRPFRLEGEGKQMRPVPVDLGPEWQPGMPLPDGVKYHGLTPNADFNVAAKISKNIDTRRQEITNFLGEWIGAVPEQVAVIGDLIWKYMDLPEHEEIEKRQRVMLAPPIQELLSGNQPVSPQAQAKIAALEQQVQEMAPLVDKNKTDLMKAQMQSQESLQGKQAEIESREKIERWKIEANLEIEMAKLGNAQMMARATIDADLLHQHNEQQHAEEQLAKQQAQEQMAQAQEQQQEAAMQQQQGQQQAALAEQGQQHALEQGEQGHQQQLEQQVNQAALAPEPVSSETP
jgi:hypothetical protein